MKWHPECRYMELNREYSIEDLARFHGHLGPFIVLGYRMGRYALRELGGNPFSLQAKVYCSGKPPQSCLADGIQIGSGCTLGKGNISLIRSDIPVTEFTGEGKTVRLTPKAGDFPNPASPDLELLIEQYAERLYTMDDDELFIVEELEQ